MEDGPLADDDVTRRDHLEELSRLPTDQDLDKLQVTTLQYYLHETNPANGLIRDKTNREPPAALPPLVSLWRPSPCSSNEA